MIDTPETASTKPYLIRALYEWCTDNSLTPFLVALVDENVQVPREYVKDGEIVLNISMDATSSLKLGNNFIEFKGRFAGKARDIMVPLSYVKAIYARENGQGMAFPASIKNNVNSPVPFAGVSSSVGRDSEAMAPEVKPAQLIELVSERLNSDSKDGSDPSRKSPPSGRPSLTRVK